MKDTENAPKHTPEPWATHTNEFIYIIGPKPQGFNEARYYIATVEINLNGGNAKKAEEAIDNARRIVAAVNATEGIPTEQLAALPVGQLAALKQQNAELAGALKNVIREFDADENTRSEAEAIQCALAALTKHAEAAGGAWLSIHEKNLQK